MTKIRDEEMWSFVRPAPALGVAWYLMASYAYYELDSPFLSDAAFDELAKFLYERWDSIEHHHKDTLDLDILSAGTRPKWYPEIAVVVAHGMVNGEYDS